MIRDIKILGLTARPSDFDSPDGDLALSLGLVNEDGALRHVHTPDPVGYLGAQARLLCIHKVNTDTGAQDNYIVLHSGRIKALCGSLPTPSTAMQSLASAQSLANCSSVESVASVGNVVIAAINGGIPNYILWKDGAYANLGSHPPYIDAVVDSTTRLRATSEIEQLDAVESSGFAQFATCSLDAGHLASLISSGSDETLSGEIREELFNTSMSYVSRLINKINEEGKFCFPCFVRLAYRMYDGSYVSATAPRLVVPSVAAKPLVMVYPAEDVTKSGEDSDKIVRVLGVLPATELSFKLSSPPDAWKSLVTGVALFVSPPVYGYTVDSAEALASLRTTFRESDHWDILEKFADNNGSVMSGQNVYTLLGDAANNAQCLQVVKYLRAMSSSHSKTISPTKGIRFVYAEAASGSAFSVGVTVNGEAQTVPMVDWQVARDRYGLQVTEGYRVYDVSSFGSDATIRVTVGNNNIPSRYFVAYSNPPSGYEFAFLDLKRVDEKGVEDLLLETANFHLLSEINIETVDFSKPLDFKFPKERLKNIVTQPALSDYSSPHTPRFTCQYSFNSRLFAGLKSRLPYCGDSLGAMLMSPWSHSTSESALAKSVKCIYFEFAANSQASTVKVDAPGDKDFYVYNIHWLWYPDSGATSAVIETRSGRFYRVQMHPHEFLPGAYALQLLEDSATSLDSYTPANLNKEIGYDGTVLYTSVNNPFVFPVGSSLQVGKGTVLGLSSNVVALSQGQFGQHPLYAFTSDGVWSLSIASDGSVQSAQPLCRDIVSNPGSILQTDLSVMFVTRRGVVALSGADAQIVTDVIDNPVGIAVDSLPGMPALKSKATMGSVSLDIAPLSRFMDGASLLNDYTHRQITLYNPQYPYSYVFSTKSKLWGMRPGTFDYGVNAYPDSFAVADGFVKNLSTDAGCVPFGILVSRPFKLPVQTESGVESNLLNTVDTVILRGRFLRGHVQTVLYGSRDLEHWHLVASSVDHCLRGFRGTPYKYFRIACLTSLSKGESISEATVQFTPRLLDQPR